MQIGAPPDKRDPELSSIIFNDMMAAIATDPKHNRTAMSELPGRAVALREALRDRDDLPLSVAERVLLAEWLNRLADGR